MAVGQTFRPQCRKQIDESSFEARGDSQRSQNVYDAFKNFVDKCCDEAYTGRLDCNGSNNSCTNQLLAGPSSHDLSELQCVL